MKRLVLLLTAFIVSIASVKAYDFSAVAPSGQMLYYKIEGNSVALTYPGQYSSWSGYVKPTGHLIIPDSVYYMGVAFPVNSFSGSAFNGCSGLTSVIMPNTINRINNGAFRGCTGLSSIIIPDSVKYIEYHAFWNCSNIFSVTILGSNCNVNQGAFEGCTRIEFLQYNTNLYNPSLMPKNNLKTVIFGNDITSIPNDAFSNATQLTKITIGSSVTSIGENAFRFCNNLDTIIAFPFNAPALGINAFQGTPTIKKVFVPCSSDYALIWGVEEFVYTINESFTLTLASNNDNWGTVSFVQVVDCQNVAIIQAIPTNGHRFVMWSDGNTDNPRTITLIQNTSINAVFEEYIVTVNVTSANELMGSTNGSGAYLADSMVVLTAISNCNYRFSHWNDGDISNPRAIRVTEDTAFVAYFELNSDTIIIYDTTYVNVSYVVHDTTIVDNWIYDTTIVVDTLTVTNYVSIHDTTFIDVFVHDTTIVNNWIYDTTIVVDTLIMTEYVPIHDTTYINVFVYDTTIVDNWIYDTTYLWQYDTTIVDNWIYDTTIVVDTLIMTEYVPVHDTTIVDNWIYDTTIVVDTLIMTEYVPVHDTTYIDVFVHDTTIVDNWIYDTTVVVDTLIMTEYVPVHDTTYIDVFVHDTTIVNNYIHDTTYLWQYDTTYIDNYIHDTTIVDNWIFDTTIVVDTLWLTQYDTVWLTLYDTLWLHDTVIVHDTICITQEGIGDVAEANIKLYQRNGRIVVDGAAGREVYMYDINGRLLATKQENCDQLLLDVPASGAYLVKIGNYPARKVVVIR